MEVVGLLCQVDLDARTGRVGDVPVVFEQTVTIDEIKAAFDMILKFTGYKCRRYGVVVMLVSKIDRCVNEDLSFLPIQARNVLNRNGIYTLEELASYRESDFVGMNRIGPLTMDRIREALQNSGKQFQKH